jgi:cytochrome c556
MNWQNPQSFSAQADELRSAVQRVVQQLPGTLQG